MGGKLREWNRGSWSPPRACLCLPHPFAELTQVSMVGLFWLRDVVLPGPKEVPFLGRVVEVSEPWSDALGAPHVPRPARHKGEPGCSWPLTHLPGIGAMGSVFALNLPPGSLVALLQALPFATCTALGFGRGIPPLPAPRPSERSPAQRGAQDPRLSPPAASASRDVRSCPGG